MTLVSLSHPSSLPAPWLGHHADHPAGRMRIPSSAPRGRESNLSLSNSPRRMPSSRAISNISQLRNLACDEKTSGNDRWLPKSRLGPIARRMAWISRFSSGSIQADGRAPTRSDRNSCSSLPRSEVNCPSDRTLLTVPGPLQEVFDNREALIECPSIQGMAISPETESAHERFDLAIPEGLPLR